MATLTSDPTPDAQAWASAFTGAFEPLAGAVRFASSPPVDALRADHLAALPRLAGVMRAYQGRYPGADMRAVVSMWWQWYAASLVAPLVCAGLLLGRRPPAGLREVAVCLDEGRPAGMVLLAGQDGAQADDPFACYASLLDDHLAVLIQGLRQVARVSESLLWNTVAMQFDWVMRTASAQAGWSGPERVLIERARRPDGTANPLYRPSRPSAQGATLLRRVCCLRYMLPGETYCAGACPLLEPRSDV